MKRKIRKPSYKLVFVIESDTARQKEIMDAMSHQEHWSFNFYDEAAECLAESSSYKTPLAVFLDIEHFGRSNDEQKGFGLINKIKDKWPETEVVVFSEQDNEQWAAEALKHGALDYIIFNPHQYLKMESEILWLEKVIDRMQEDNRFKKRLIWMAIGFVVFILTIVVLYEMGILKEGKETKVFIGL